MRMLQETPRLDADMVLDSHGHGNTQPDEAAVAQPAATGSELDKGGSRTRLTDQQKLLLVRLCVLHGEEYLGPKEVFWTKRMAEILQKTGKRIGNPRAIVADLLRKFKAEVAVVS